MNLLDISIFRNSEPRAEAEITSQALSVIDTVVAHSNFTLTAIAVGIGILGIILAIITFFGLKAMRKYGEDITDKKIEKYIESTQFATLFLKKDSQYAKNMIP